jgi:hypothetical protein
MKRSAILLLLALLAFQGRAFALEQFAWFTLKATCTNTKTNAAVIPDITGPVDSIVGPLLGDATVNALKAAGATFSMTHEAIGGKPAYDVYVWFPTQDQLNAFVQANPTIVQSIMDLQVSPTLLETVVKSGSFKIEKAGFLITPKNVK